MLQPGDKVWYGAKAVTDVYSDGAVDIESWDDNEIHTFDEYLIPDVPNLAQIARFLAQHPETVDALEERLDRCHLVGTGEETEFSKIAFGFLKAMRGEGGHE